MTSINELNHVKIKTKNGAQVFVLDKGETIDSESEAMLQALHSRSTGGFENHLKILAEKGADNFMSKFYVGYGHKSIGDCGSTTLFIEGVSMLAAKAIQDSKLYSGQEASTRYVDFSKQKFINPLNSEEGNDILEEQRSFYLEIMEPIKEHLKILFPIKDEENEKIYNKAIAAKAFDIARGYLPSGASTNLAWHSNLRQISDRLLFLRHHKLKEIREVAIAIEEAVNKKFPNSFSKKRYEKTEEYQDLISDHYYYHNPNAKDFEYDLSKFNFNELKKYQDLLTKRPPKTELPQILNNLGEMEFQFKIDFGSFRDVQRHRAVNQRMPLITTELGFNEFYFESLPEDLKLKAKEHIETIKTKIDALDISKEEIQYYIPMGFNISNYITGSLPAITYLVEIRATRFVHPTLRKIAIKMSEILANNGITLNIDKEPDRFDIKRGEHDIEIK